MNITIEHAASPVWMNAEHSMLNLLVKFGHLEEEVQFTAMLEDSQEHGQWLFAEAVAGTFGPVAEYVAPASVEPTVPEVVSRFQARVALYQAGLLETVESIMADPATPMLARLAWQDAQEFRRHSPTVLSMGAVLGLTDTQLDALFTSASTIQA